MSPATDGSVCRTELKMSKKTQCVQVVVVKVGGQSEAENLEALKDSPCWYTQLDPRRLHMKQQCRSSNLLEVAHKLAPLSQTFCIFYIWIDLVEKNYCLSNRRFNSALVSTFF